jgi:hypothetical protein
MGRKDPLMQDPTGLEPFTPVTIQSTSATERAGFRKCRRQWFLTTVHRLDSNQGNVNFFLGNIYHAALAAYYTAQYNNEDIDVREILALDTYQMEYDSQVETLVADLGSMWTYIEPTFREAGVLGLEMLQNYLERERLEPLFDEVIAVEFRVNVPITNIASVEVGILSVQADVVGRKNGELAVADHKTASRVMPSSHLDIDDQLTAEVYSWWKFSGEFPEKAIYNVSYKKAVGPPAQIKGSKAKPIKLSKAKGQATTAALYRAEIEALGLDIGDYVDILTTLEERAGSEDDMLFRREAVFRTPGQMESFERDLYYEWTDMQMVAAEPERAYPNPTSMNCSNCPVRAICTTLQDNGDAESIIKAGYTIADPRR